MKLKIIDGLKALAVLGCAVGLLGCQATVSPSGEWVKVSRVVSGQALEVLNPQRSSAQAERVVLIGIAAPHWQQQPWSLEAKAQLEALIGEDRRVLLESDLESYRRAADGSQVRLAYVWRGDQLLNEQLVAAGRVLAQEQVPNTKYQPRLEQAQEKARLLGQGIWHPRQPMRQTPAEFRQQLRSSPKMPDTDR